MNFKSVISGVKRDYDGNILQEGVICTIESPTENFANKFIQALSNMGYSRVMVETEKVEDMTPIGS